MKVFPAFSGIARNASARRRAMVPSKVVGFGFRKVRAVMPGAADMERLMAWASSAGVEATPPPKRDKESMRAAARGSKDALRMRSADPSLCSEPCTWAEQETQRHKKNILPSEFLLKFFIFLTFFNILIMTTVRKPSRENSADTRIGPKQQDFYAIIATPGLRPGQYKRGVYHARKPYRP
jgi:hypothetical protein